MSGKRFFFSIACLLGTVILAGVAIAGPTVSIDPASSGPINCSQSVTLDVDFTPDGGTPAMRGYSIYITCTSGLTFDETDITEGSAFDTVVGDANTFEIIDEGGGVYSVNSAILGPTAGLTVAADLFSVTFHGASTETATADIQSATLRDLLNEDIADVVLADGTVDVDCTAPTIPTITAEPAYTAGLTNTIDWSDESGTGATEYNAERATDSGFTTDLVDSGWIAGTSHEFTGLLDTQIYYYRVKTRDALDNQSDWATYVSSTQDDVDPTSSADAQPAYQTSLTFDVAFTSSDATAGVNYVELYYQLDGGGYVQFAGTFPTTPISFTAPSDGAYDFYTIATDNAGNVEAAPGVADASTTVDTTAPTAAADLSAAAGYEETTVTWTDPGGADVVSVEIWRGLWHNGSGVSVYPEYDDDGGSTIPTRPADRAAADASGEWALAGTVAPGTGTFTDTGLTTRGIYYYEIFGVDNAGLYSAPAAASDLATCYWLADVDATYDGYVNTADVSEMGAAFGESDGDGNWDNEVDVGPTDDHSGTGIPDTDDIIDFEDMMIFALNYSVVAPAKDDSGPHPGTQIPMLSWQQIEENVWALALAEPCATLKAVHLTGNLPANVSVDLDGGELLQEQDMPFFLANIAANGLDVNLSIMGDKTIFAGEGELFRINLSEAAEPGAITVAARGVENEALEFQLDSLTAVPLPTVYFLGHNYPNPFNPSTSILFDLPETQRVTLGVFDVRGRRVATLVDGEMPAGSHTVTWHGRDDRGQLVSSGMYLYKIDAGPLQATRRMMLMK